MSDSISSLKRRDFLKRTLTFSAATALTSGSLQSEVLLMVMSHR